MPPLPAVRAGEPVSGTGKVCPNCNYHARLTAAERLRITADKNSFVEYDAGMHSADPLHFPDYAQKIERSQTQTGMRDAVITGECTIKGSRTVLIIWTPIS